MRYLLYRSSMLLLGVLLLVVVPSPVYAHPGDPTLRFGSFLAGLTHPVLGFDHFLAMVSVGIVSAQIGGRAIWTIPATFVSVMAVGGLIGATLPEISLIETGIAVSVIFLGGVIAIERQMPFAFAMIAVAFFAIIHGFAHGNEIPEIARPWVYAGGFLTGTAIIHILGVFLGDIPRHYEYGKWILRAGGGVISFAGFLFLIGIL